MTRGPLLVLLAATALPSPAAEYFVSPDGKDDADGTKAAPFATLQRAQQAVVAGDTVVVRGGTYVMTDAHISRRTRLHAWVTHLDKSGREDAPIRYVAAAGEVPVFDFSAVKPPGRRVSAFHVSGSWIQLRGLDVRGVQVTMTGHTQSICFSNSGSHNVFEALRMHDGQAIGYYSTHGSHNLVLNCDAWANHDFTSENKRGGNVDGFGCHPDKGSVRNVFRGCRAWLNSDDGFDLIMAAEPVVIEDCWAMRNGLDARGRRLADGNGFKAGGYAATPARDLPRPIPRHIVRRCVAAGNAAAGFYANHHPAGLDWINNSAFGNSSGFSFLNRTPDNATDVPGTGHRLVNNLAHRNRRAVTNLAPTGNFAAGNAFDGLADADFLSLDPSELTQPRPPDGTLPKVRFLRPAKGSRLIDAGQATGLPFSGMAPDVGAFETP